MDSVIMVHFSENSKIVIASQSNSLLSSLIQNEVPISHSCGGNGTCGTCRVIVLKGIEQLESPNEIEKEMIISRQFRYEERLSCQIKPTSGLELQIP